MKHLIVISFLLFSVYGFSQNKGYQLEIFGTRNGLNSSKIYSLFQAQNKKLCIGTELGLSIYNGYEFDNYQYAINNKSIGRVLCIAEDKQHNIWFGGDRGLFVFTNNEVHKMESKNGIQLALESLFADSDGNIWIGGIDALYNLGAKKAEAVLQSKNHSIDISPFLNFTKRAYGISQNEKRDILISSHNGIFSIKHNRTNIDTLWKNPRPENFIRSAAEIDNIIYFTDDNGEISELKNGRIYKAANQKDYSWRIIKGVKNNYILASSGLSLLKNTVQPLLTFGSSANNVLACTEDAEGNIWIGSWEGLFKYRKTAFKQYPVSDFEHKEIFSLLETGNGNIFLGGNRGAVFEKQNDVLIKSHTIPALFKSAEVQCMYQSPDGAWWAGSGYEGISCYKNKRLYNWKNTGFLKDNNCEALYKTRNGNLFACTENGVTVIDPAADSPFTQHYPFANTYVRLPELFGCAEINGIYFFYGSSGLFRLKNDLLYEDSVAGLSMPNLYINKISADNEKNIWIATQGKGLLKCSYSNGKITLEKRYNNKSGLPSDNILSVLVDKNKTTWIGDYMSLTAISNTANGEQIIVYNEKDGLLSAYYQTLKLEQQENGTVWGLTSMGAFSFHPDSINNNPLLPSLELNAVTAGGLKENFFNVPGPVFAFTNNSLRFYFTAISLTDPSKIRYAYRIKELDTSWVYTSQREAVFNYLPSGKYSFELKACNNSNTWTNYLTYHFSIQPPFWKTWWFTLLYSLLAGAIVFALYKQRIKGIRNKASVKQQLAELESKALRAQMNPHFIFNSLNAIQELIVTKKVDEGYQYLSNFSKLLRQVLNNSEKNLIPLSSEIEMIKLQLSLESLRFKKAFTYTIDVDENIETEMINVPPLLLQPYVENAVWHGLRHKEGNKNLWIRIKETGQQIEVEIEDNGVGRQKAEEIKKQKLGAGQFESKGSLLSAQRIKLLASQYSVAAAVNIKDNKNERGEATGTIVKIILPSDLK